MSEKIEWKWLGKNEFIPGVPARDLLVGEAEKRGIVSVVENSSLFKRIKPKAAKKEKENGS